MLSYNDITQGVYIVLDGEPYEVLTSQTSKKSRQKASNQTKLKHLKTGKVTERAFHQSDNVPEADIAKKPVVFIYASKGEVWFHKAGDKGARFSLPESMMGNSLNFLKAQEEVEALVFDGEEIIGINPPPKVDLRVKEAPPAVKGNTAQGATKAVVLETGASVTAPLFIDVGDIVRVNTQTGLYVERVKKG